MFLWLTRVPKLPMEFKTTLFFFVLNYWIIFPHSLQGGSVYTERGEVLFKADENLGQKFCEIRLLT